MNRTQSRREESQVVPPEVGAQKGRDRFGDGGGGEEPSEPWAQSQALGPAQQQRVYLCSPGLALLPAHHTCRELEVTLDLQGLAWSCPLDSKESACNAGDPGLILGQGRSLEEAVATHSSILAWKIPWAEEPSGLGGHKESDTLDLQSKGRWAGDGEEGWPHDTAQAEV